MECSKGRRGSEAVGRKRGGTGITTPAVFSNGFLKSSNEIVGLDAGCCCGEQQYQQSKNQRIQIEVSINRPFWGSPHLWKPPNIDLIRSDRSVPESPVLPSFRRPRFAASTAKFRNCQARKPQLRHQPVTIFEWLQ